MSIVKIAAIRKIERRTRYDLTINSTHNFYANGILIHNTSGISSKILCKKNLTVWNKIGKLLGFDVKTEEYDYIYSSRKVVKNDAMNLPKQHYYSEDIWGKAHETLKEYLKNGMTFYYEIVGYLSDGSMIQKGYDYGCVPGTFKTLIYRITSTNTQGDVVEWPMSYVQDFCKMNGLNAVEELYYGFAKDLFKKVKVSTHWNQNFLQALTDEYLEKDATDCIGNPPDEGIVLRREVPYIDVFKHKSFRFLAHESKMNDAGEADIESQGE